MHRAAHILLPTSFSLCGYRREKAMLPVGKEDINQVNETNKGRDIPMLQTDRNTCKCKAVINFLVSGLAL